MSKVSNPFIRTLSLMGIIIASVSMVGVANAADKALPALSYDQAGERLLKVDSNQLFQSMTGGENWQAIRLPEAVQNGQLLTAQVSAAKDLYIAGPSIGVQRSRDNGETWQALNDDLPSQNVIAFTPHRNQPQTLYAVVAEDGIYRSEDAGASWKKVDSGPTQTIRRLLHSDMEGSMQSGWLYAVSDDAVRVSMDCFCGWRPTGEMNADQVYDATYDVNDPKRVYVATAQGLFRSKQGGRKWQLVNNDGKEKVAVAMTSSGQLYALTRNGELLRSDDQGQSWKSP